MRRLLDVLVLDILVLGAGLLLSVPAGAAPRAGFGWPLAGTPHVDRAFEPPVTDYGPGHRGVDLRASVGSPVLAAGAGWVSYAGLLAGRGVLAVTHPGGLRTTYEPVVASVSVGDQVAQGEVLGTLSTGHASCRAGTTCLHWGLRRGDAYLDPLALVVAGPVRLLPLGARVPQAAVPVVKQGAGPVVPPTDVPVKAARVGGRLQAAAEGTGAAEHVGMAGALTTGSVLLGTAVLARRAVRRRPGAG